MVKSHVYSCLTYMERDERSAGAEEEALLEQAQKPQCKEPPKYRVLLHNDDYTPMDFVVGVLEVFFHMDRAQATRIMLQVHTQGIGLCGIFTRDVAETKVNQVNDFSRNHQYPLLCTMEADD